MSPPSAPELARRLADALETQAIPYAIGGALALGVWGFPRATQDVDLDVFVDAEALGPVFEVLEQSGCVVERSGAEASAKERGDFQAWHGPVRVDVFVASIPFYEQMRARKRQAPLEGRPAAHKCHTTRTAAPPRSGCPCITALSGAATTVEQEPRGPAAVVLLGVER